MIKEMMIEGPEYCAAACPLSTNIPVPKLVYIDGFGVVRIRCNLTHR